MKEIKFNEYVSLLKIRVFYSGGAYTLNVESGAKKAPDHFVFRGDHDSFVRFLMGIKAKDNKTWPRSVRGERYTDIANEIENGSDPIIYVWEHDYMRYINKKKEDEKMKIVKTPRQQESSQKYYSIEDFWNNYFKSAEAHWAPEESRWSWDGVGYYLRSSDKFCFLYSDERFEDLTIQTDVTVTEVHDSEVKVIEADDRRIRITLKTGAHIRIDL